MPEEIFSIDKINSMGPAVKPSLSRDDIDRIKHLSHHNPHGVLGAHPVHSHGVVVRAYRPGATAASVIRGGEESIKMVQIDPSGFFEAWFEEETDVFSYEIEVKYGPDRKFRYRDAYTFLPTLGDLDLYLFAEGRHTEIYRKLGSHFHQYGDVKGVSFAVWAPSAKSISIVGDFNGWDGRLHQMRVLGSSGIWETFIPDVPVGACYKYEIRTHSGHLLMKADPYAQAMEMPPKTASVVHQSGFHFSDHEWMEKRKNSDLLRRPMSIYEVHIGSWKRVPEEGNRPLNYRELAHHLAEYVSGLGFTHVEFMPVMEHPFGGSWGYQVSAYYAPTSRHGSPDDFKYLVNHLHEKGIGIILDWVPAHFPKDQFALGRFDGTALYEHADPKQGEHPDWGTLIFNYGRNEVRSFLLANALYWLREFHIDGLRIDAVASMLYLDYSRKEGEWIPNRYGGRENLETITFLKELNEIAHSQFPGVMMIAEESTAWMGVSRPTYLGGLGFGFKWNMGWMHDTLVYFSKEPIHRRFHHNMLTFGLLYAWTENFLLPLSHDEVVHGKGSLINKMPGDRWQKFANLRSLYAYMWAHPGKKLLFMGGELGQWSEWRHDQSLDWHIMLGEEHAGMHKLFADMNRVYRDEPALWEADSESSGFQWVDLHDVDANVISFLRVAPHSGRMVLCICNFSPVVRQNYRIGVPSWGWYRELLNTDAQVYGGSNVGNYGGVHSDGLPWQGQSCSASFNLPPLATLWFEVPR